MTSMSAILAAQARLLAGRSARGSESAGLWPLAAVLLARLAIEQSLRDLWQLCKVPKAGSCSMRTQMLCLGEYLDDGDLVVDVRSAWSALSRACHHHPYELGPAAEELRYWIGVAETFAEAVDAPFAPERCRGD